MPATNENLLNSLDQQNKRIHYMAEEYTKKIDDLYEQGKYKIYENKFVFSFIIDNPINDEEKIAKEMEILRGYECVMMKSMINDKDENKETERPMPLPENINGGVLHCLKSLLTF